MDQFQFWRKVFININSSSTKKMQLFIKRNNWLTKQLLNLTLWHQRRKEKLQDLALLTGATVINEDLGDDLDIVDVAHLGSCLKSITNSEETIIQVEGTSEEVQVVIDEVKKEITDGVKKQGIDTEFTKDIQKEVTNIKKKVTDNIDDLTGPIKRNL